MLMRGGGLRATGVKGLGFAPGYRAVGYCPGTNLPNYMAFPDGSYQCVTDAQMMQLACSGTSVPNFTQLPNGSYQCIYDPAAPAGSSGGPPATPPVTSTPPTPPIVLPPPTGYGGQPAVYTPPVSSQPATVTAPSTDLMLGSFDVSSFFKQYGWWVAGGVGAVVLIMMLEK